MKAIAVDAEKRVDTGKKSTKALRKKNFVPCVIYGGRDLVHFAAHENDFRKIVYTPDFSTVSVTVEGKSYETILKAIQFHPVTDKILHMDFQELIPGTKVVAEIPIRLEGLAVGVKAGGKLMPIMRKVRVRTTPEKLVSEIVLDVSHLELGKAVRVRDIDLESMGMEAVLAGAIPVATVEITRALRAAQSGAAATGTPAPAVEGGAEE